MSSLRHSILLYGSVPSNLVTLSINDITSNSQVENLNLSIEGILYGQDLSSSSEVSTSNISVNHIMQKNNVVSESTITEGQLQILQSLSFNDISTESNITSLDLTSVPKFNSGNFPDYTLTLPELRIESTFGLRLSLDKKLPEVRITSYFGIASNNLKLPELRIVSTAYETVAIENISCSADCLLPPLKIETEVLTGNFNFDLTLPGITIQATINEKISITLNSYLSELRIVSSGYCNSLDLDSNLPTLIMTPIAYGDNYGSGSSIIGIVDRFDDFLLRYSRW